MPTQPAPLPAATQEVIFLDPDDDLGTVRAKLESTSADEVYLVVPRRASILRTPLEFRILARLTHALSSETVIVTGDGSRRALARQEGLRTKRSIRSLRHLSRPPGTFAWELPALPEWVPLPSFTGLVMLTFLAAVVAGLVFGVLPIMQVTVSAQTVAQQKDVEIAVDPSAKQPDVSRQILPGEVLQQRVEVVGSLPASGTKKVGRDRARGEVVFLSQHPQPVALPRGSNVIASNGVRFQTDIDVQIPAFSQGLARVGVTAIDAGPIGNVDARQITTVEAPNIQNITARNDRPTTGGTDRDARSVTAEDVAKLRDQLQARAREQALAELYARTGPDRSFVQQSVQLRNEGEAFDPGVDAEADQVNGRLALSATAVVFKNSEFNGLVQSIFMGQAGPGFDLPVSQLSVGTPQVLEVQNQRVRLRTSSQATLVRQVNADELAEQLRGKTPAEARSLLARFDSLAGAPRIDISPPWAPRAYRVEVAVK
ncbi:MAG: baseplate J/gp47 family protein [Chloroflexi bacterium]|nr:baseplate J/gp47 family protein [Chloroflexota bacterium]